MIFIFRCDFLFRPYPAVLKHTDVFPFQNSHHVLIQTESTPIIFYSHFPDFRTGKKRGQNDAYGPTGAFLWRWQSPQSCTVQSKQLIGCVFHKQLEVSLLLKPAVTYSHSLVCLPIQNHNADWFIVGAIRRNLCGHVDGGKPLCLKCLEL